MKYSRSILVLVVATLSILLVGSVGNTQTTCAAATPIAIVQENAALRDQPDVAKALREVKSPPAVGKAGATFEASHPRFVRAVRKGKIPFQVFDVVWNGRQGSDEIASFVAQYEAGKLTTEQLVGNVLQHGRIKIMDDPATCAGYGSSYYAGCMAGGGDAFICFVLTEQMICMCETGGGCELLD